MNQKITAFTLEKKSYNVEIANNGLEAVNKYKEKEYDLILMDIMMPVMDGLEATKEIRKMEKKLNSHKYTPIIAITANTMDNDRDKCLSIGMDEFMNKPFDIEELTNILTELNLI